MRVCVNSRFIVTGHHDRKRVHAALNALRMALSLSTESTDSEWVDHGSDLGDRTEYQVSIWRDIETRDWELYPSAVGAATNFRDEVDAIAMDFVYLLDGVSIEARTRIEDIESDDDQEQEALTGWKVFA